MRIEHTTLRQFVHDSFAAAGCNPHESGRIAHYLTEANLVGHDSHGVIRVATYLAWLRDGKVLANREARVLSENHAVAVVDGQFGFGQVMGEAAMELAIAKTRRHGVAVVALRNSGHLGRIGDWAEKAAAAGLLSLHFVNTSGGGLLVAPTGGIDRRLSANPIAAGAPSREGPPFILDLSTSTIAEGKIRVAFNKGMDVPEGCLIDAEGRPTTDPKVFYGDPPGAILPVGGHKGYALAYLVELLAGALTGGGCTAPDVRRVVNNMLTITLAPSFFRAQADFDAEVERFRDFVRGSRKAGPGAEILVPGEPEWQTRQRRLAEGIELDENTWRQLVTAAEGVGVRSPQSVVRSP